MGLYGGVRLLEGSRDPGPGWLVGHGLMFVGLLLFGVVLAALRRGLRPRGAVGRLAADAAAGTAFAGLVASLGQIGIDLYVGAVAVDKADQHRLFDVVQSRPGCCRPSTRSVRCCSTSACWRCWWPPRRAGRARCAGGARCWCWSAPR
ncbi:hypothetical protein ACFQ0M_21465 [Kitasatospora aburaviensis]